MRAHSTRKAVRWHTQAHLVVAMLPFAFALLPLGCVSGIENVPLLQLLWHFQRFRFGADHRPILARARVYA